jgi:hypothetical protein
MEEIVLPVIFPENSIPVKSYKKKDFRALYGFHRNTLNNIIQKNIDKFIELGYNKHSQTLHSKQVALFFELYGTP